VFPSTPLLAYCEHYYRAKGADVGFDPSYPVKSGNIGRLKVRNFAQVQALLEADAGLSPTNWQKGGFPEAFQPRIEVIHEGIDTAFCGPDPGAKFVLPDGRTVKAGDPVVTFAARHLEPYRGFPQFMRAAAKLAARNPAAVFLVAGTDGAGYGAMPRNGLTWRETLLRETGMDPTRIHFLGTLPHEQLVRLFQVSAAHVYLTYPFVLSWSMLEAMAAGVLLIGSATPPVEEFVTGGDNGILVPFFDEDRLAQVLGTALNGLPKGIQLRQAARKTVVDRLQLSVSLKRQSELLARLIRGRS
jgi:glycosyltransferase involved in cell wall biosynthesis